METMESRRKFIGLAAGTVAGTLALPAWTQQKAKKADAKPVGDEGFDTTEDLMRAP